MDNNIDKYSYERYIQLIKEENYDFAKKYRHDAVPRTLYKFFSLSSSGLTKMDSKKLRTLENNEIWLACSEAMDDPFECEGLFISKEFLDNKKVSSQHIKSIMRTESKFNKEYAFSSFTTECWSNISMWAHYTNNHKGFCIEYDVLNPELFYEVNYGNDRYSITNPFVSMLNGMGTDKEMYLIFEKYLYKHVSWKYQNEYRLIYPQPLRGLPGGKTKLNYVGLKVNSIVAGLNCNRKNRTWLENIAEDLQCEYTQIIKSANDFSFINKE